MLKQDKSVVPALKDLARNSPTVLGRFHALWTLEGLGALDAALAREMMRDLNPLLRVQAIRASETLYKAGDKSFEADYRQLTKDPDTRVDLQAILTLNLFKVPDIRTVITSAQAANKARGVQEIGTRILQPAANAFGRGGGRGGAVTAEQQALLQQGAGVYAELCVTCHGPDGKGMPVDGAPAGTMKAPPLAGSARVQAHYSYVVNAVMHGLTGPVDGNTYTDVMIPMGTNKDDWIAAIASYVRNGFGNTGTIISPADVARVRAATASRKASWSVEELESMLPRLIAAQPTWIATASHNPQTAPAALTGGAWSTGGPQQAGMWFQLELPSAMSITEIQFNSPGVVAGGGRGRRGALRPRQPRHQELPRRRGPPVAAANPSDRRTVAPRALPPRWPRRGEHRRKDSAADAVGLRLLPRDSLAATPLTCRPTAAPGPRSPRGRETAEPR